MFLSLLSTKLKAVEETPFAPESVFEAELLTFMVVELLCEIPLGDFYRLFERLEWAEIVAPMTERLWVITCCAINYPLKKC